MAEGEATKEQEGSSTVEVAVTPVEVKEERKVTIATEGDKTAAEVEATSEGQGSPAEKKDEKSRHKKRPPPKRDGSKKDVQRKGKEPAEQQKEIGKEEDASLAAEGDKVDGGAKPAAESPKVRKAPYLNPDRFRTGGQQKEKLTDEELAERMERIRLNNEKIKERRLAVEADEQAFKASQELLRQKQVKERRIQEGINRSREQNAQRKMEKIQGREWDNEKNQRGSGPRSPAGQSGRGRGRGGTPARTAAKKVVDGAGGWPSDSMGTDTSGWATDAVGTDTASGWNTDANDPFANVKTTPAQAPSKKEASPVRSPSITRDAPPHTEPQLSATAQELGW